MTKGTDRLWSMPSRVVRVKRKDYALAAAFSLLPADSLTP
jgi:hypothetical protein